MQQGEGTSRGRRRVSPAWLIAVAALIASLAGTAVAVDKITSKDIAPSAVRSKHIKDEQVKTRDADLVKFRHSAPSVLTETPTPENGGPQITGQAKPGDLLNIHVRVDIERLSGDAGCGVFLGVQGPGGESGSNILIGSAASPQTRWLNTGNSGATVKHEAVMRTVPVVEGGPYRISLSYYSGNAGTDCAFTDRNLWVEQVR